MPVLYKSSQSSAAGWLSFLRQPIEFCFRVFILKNTSTYKTPNVEPCEEHARATDSNIKLTVQKCHSNKTKQHDTQSDIRKGNDDEQI